MPIAADVSFSCTCGTLRGRLKAVTPRNGGHIECFCRDCRGAVIHLNHPDPAPGPVGYFQVTPDRVTFEAGADQLAVFKMYPKSRLYRWHAACCGAPLFNTLDKPTWAFASLVTDRVEDPSVFGPVQCEGFMAKPNGKYRHRGLPAMIWGFAKRVIAARVSGRWKKTPFFEVPGGAPVAELRVLTSEERAALPLKA